MELKEINDTLQTLQKQLATLAERLHIEKHRARISEIETEQQQPNFWNDQQRAQGLSQELALLKEDTEFIDHWQKELKNLEELSTLLETEKDEAAHKDLEKDLTLVQQTFAQKEKELRFNGPHDRSGVIMTIQSGAGGTDAQDWAEMLERMYLRFCEQKGWKVKMLDRSVAEEAGIKHSTFEIEGKYVYGLLKNEHGVHRLVRLSPFNADNLRQTSFARIEVVPKIAAREAPEINPKDLRIDTYRAGGAGGQHVNKTSSAVRLTHLPTGIVVQCQNERSQGQNKAQAMSVLQAKLVLLAEKQHVATVNELKGETKEAAWGNQIRSYVLHPYTLVKDHRTKEEVTDVYKVLEGDLTAFVESPMVY